MRRRSAAARRPRCGGGARCVTRRQAHRLQVLNRFARPQSRVRRAIEVRVVLRPWPTAWLMPDSPPGASGIGCPQDGAESGVACPCLLIAMPHSPPPTCRLPGLGRTRGPRARSRAGEALAFASLGGLAVAAGEALSRRARAGVPPPRPRTRLGISSAPPPRPPPFSARAVSPGPGGGGPFAHSAACGIGLPAGYWAGYWAGCWVGCWAGCWE